jgi:5-carboxymethyl-2-hydroxymuconate isomerase
MPHLTLDYSGNLRDTGRFDVLCAALARTLVAFEADGKRVYPVGGVRVRAFAADHWCIGDGRADTAYVHARVSMAAGRSAEIRKATGDALLDVMKAHFADLFARQGLALSLEITEFGEDGTWKHNNLHARMRGP